MSEEIVWFSDVKEYQNELGKKGYAIAKLYQKRYPFASGFILSKNVYRGLLDDNTQSAMKAVLLNIEKESAQKQAVAYEKIQSVLQSTQFSEELRAEHSYCDDPFFFKEQQRNGKNKCTSKAHHEALLGPKSFLYTSCDEITESFGYCGEGDVDENVSSDVFHVEADHVVVE